MVEKQCHTWSFANAVVVRSRRRPGVRLFVKKTHPRKRRFHGNNTVQAITRQQRDSNGNKFEKVSVRFINSTGK